MIHWKFSALCAGIAALLSVTAGLIGRVSAGALIFRAILSCIVFGGLSVGLESLVRKFLPELFSSSEDVDNEDEEVETGGEVDIIVDDEEPMSYAPVNELDAADRDDQLEEVAELSESGISGSEEDLEELEGNPDVSAEAKAPMDGASTDNEEPVKSGANGNGLPNIEEFSGSYSGSTGGAVGIDSLDSGKAKRLEAVDSIESENDPATMAQAIRSILRKDQEG